jgi:hypothetical protein
MGYLKRVRDGERICVPRTGRGKQKADIYIVLKKRKRKRERYIKKN